MDFLTYEEYKTLRQNSVSEDKFKAYYPKALAALHNLTRRFYIFNDFETDVEWRKEAFKQAICFQVDYFNTLGASDFESINDTPQSVQLGRTMISNVSRFNSKGTNEKKSLISFETVQVLEGTGLLYRGVN